jgi:hypothetical protein
VSRKIETDTAAHGNHDVLTFIFRHVLAGSWALVVQELKIFIQKLCFQQQVLLSSLIFWAHAIALVISLGADGYHPCILRSHINL